MPTERSFASWSHQTLKHSRLDQGTPLEPPSMSSKIRRGSMPPFTREIVKMGFQGVGANTVNTVEWKRISVPYDEEVYSLQV